MPNRKQAALYYLNYPPLKAYFFQGWSLLASRNPGWNYRAGEGMTCAVIPDLSTITIGLAGLGHYGAVLLQDLDDLGAAR